jgi:hypothetical protein
LWNKHQAKDNQALAKDAILDCLSLSRCRYALKCMSQLSAFAKVLNPELDIYRVSACKPSWFPEAYIPVYRSKNEAVRSLLQTLQAGDFQESYYKRLLGVHRRIGRIVKQAWKKRNVVSAAVQKSG